VIASVRTVPRPRRLIAICGRVTRLRMPNQEELASASTFALSEGSEPMIFAYSAGSGSAFLPSSMNFIATAIVVGR
jgi:hypothetical protein